MNGPAYILVWCGPEKGLQSSYFSDTAEGRKLLRASLASLSGPLIYFVRVYREATEQVVADLNAIEH